MIRIDGQPLNAHVVLGENLEEMLSDLQERHLPPERLVSDVLLNGVSYSEDVPHAALEVPRSSVESLEVITLSAEQVALHCLKQGPEIIDALLAALPKITEMFRLGDEAEANEQFLRFLEPLHLLAAMLDQIRRVMGLSFEASVGESGSIDDRLGRLAGVLGQIQRTQEQADWVFLADLLEYELAPEMENLKNMLPRLRETAH